MCYYNTRKMHLQKGITMTVKENLKFSYSLGEEKEFEPSGLKLRSHTIKARQILVRPSDNKKEKYWVVTGVNEFEDINFIGEIFIKVEPEKGVAICHETFVTVESGMRSGILGRKNMQTNSDLERERIKTLDVVRKHLMHSYEELLRTNGEIDNQLLMQVAEDMKLARTNLRKDSRTRIEGSVGFLDSLGRRNPRANAARLLAAIMRIVKQIQADYIKKQSLRYRYLNCLTYSENIAADLWDMEFLLKRLRIAADKSQSEITREKKFINSQFALRLDRLEMKPYFWGVIYIRNNYKESEYGIVENAQAIVNVLLCEQVLGQVDDLLSEYKRGSRAEKLTVLRRITMLIGRQKTVELPACYKQLLTQLASYIHRNLGVSGAVMQPEYVKRAEKIQEMIRYRAMPKEVSEPEENPWFIPSTKKLFEKLECLPA